MELSKTLWLVGVILFVIVFFYVILPKLNLKHRSGMIMRGVLFFGMIAYLGFDFFQKEKYGYIVVLALGSIAFVLLLTAKKSNNSD